MLLKSRRLWERFTYSSWLKEAVIMQVHLAMPPADPYLLPASASCPVEAAAKLITLSGTVGSDPRPNSSFPESLDCTPPQPKRNSSGSRA